MKTLQNDEIYSCRIDGIKKLQKIVIFLFSFLIISLAVFIPISNEIKKTNVIEFYDEYDEDISLARLHPNQKVYLLIDGKYSYLFTKDANNEVVVYSFSTSQNLNIKNYFGSNLRSGKPSVFFVNPEFAYSYICLEIIIILIIIRLCFLIHNYSQEEIIHLTKTNTDFIFLKNALKNEDIGKYLYKTYRRHLFANEILKNNKLLNIFKFLY